MQFLIYCVRFEENVQKPVVFTKPHYFVNITPLYGEIDMRTFNSIFLPIGKSVNNNRNISTDQSDKMLIMTLHIIIQLQRSILESGYEKYREHGSAAPRKGPFCQEGRSPSKEK